MHPMHSRPFVLVFVLGLAFGVAGGLTPMAAQDFPLSDGVFDWPLGQTDAENELILNRGFYVQQNFGNIDGPSGLNVCGRAHAGTDFEVALKYDGAATNTPAADTKGRTVYAAADGRVLCTYEMSNPNDNTTGYPGRVLLVEHHLPDASTVYSVYAHLAGCDTTAAGCADSGDDVARGDVLGTILDQGVNSHLHFEIRTFPYWNMTSGEEGPADELTPATDPKSCPGRGYAYSASAALDDGYLDPVSYILAHRPPLPETVRVRAKGGLVLESSPVDTVLGSQPPLTSMVWDRPEPEEDLYYIGESEAIRPIALFRSPEFKCQATDSVSTNNDLDYRADGGAGCGNQCIVTETCDQACADACYATCYEAACTPEDITHGLGQDCADGACDWWYQVEYEDSEGTLRQGFVKAFEKSYLHYSLTQAVSWLKGNAYRSVILVGETRQDADPWLDPEDPPLVDYGFDQPLVSGSVANGGSLAALSAEAVGTVTRSTFADDAVDQALVLDGTSAALEVQLSDGLGSEVNGFELDAWVERQSASTVDVIASQWSVDPAEQRWRLEIVPADEAGGIYYDELRFTLLRDDLNTSVARFAIPDCSHVGTWVRIGASYDPADDEIRLYWKGRPVAKASLEGNLLEDVMVPLLFGGTADGGVYDEQRFHGRLDKVRFWSSNPLPNVDTVLILDSSGSMASNDPSNRRRDAAKSYLTAALGGDHVGVVDFDSSARVASYLRRLPEEKAALESAINTVDSSGSTHLGRGLTAGCNVLIDPYSVSSNTIKAAIMLTDGNGSYTAEAQCFADQGWLVYTFGLGVGNTSVDDVVLTEIATATGGEYKRLPTGELVCEFQRVRALLVGGTAADCVEQQVMSGQTVTSDVEIAYGVGEVTFNTSWPGSDVVMTLTSPSGRVIDRNTVAVDVFHDVGPTWEVYTIIAPEPGSWEVALFGADVPSTGEPVTFGFNTLPGLTPACEHVGSAGDWLYCTPECPCGEGLGDCNDDSDCLPGLSCAEQVGASYGYASEVDVCRSDCHDGYPGDWGHCTVACPCDDGLGDCNDDSECAPGLSCAENTGALYGWSSEVDVCSSDCHSGLPGDWGYCSAACPCPEGLGDCNSDAECQTGLFCVDNAGLNLDLPSNIDVCSSNCHQGVVGDWGYCTSNCPCDEGLGDCNTDSECSPGLRCAQNVGALYGFPSGIDVCTSDCHDGVPGDWGYCTAGCPCDAGQGDCNSDADCQAGLVCVDNVGANYGWGGGIDVCQQP